MLFGEVQITLSPSLRSDSRPDGWTGRPSCGGARGGIVKRIDEPLMVLASGQGRTTQIIGNVAHIDQEGSMATSFVSSCL